MTRRFSPENPFKEVQSPGETSVRAAESQLKGLSIEQYFSRPGVHPFDQLEWERRSAKIASDSGQAIFEQNDVEVPSLWSQLATKVVASKYFYGDVETGQREHSAKQLVHRVCRMIADRGKRDGYFASDEDGEAFYDELTWLCVKQYGAFNSPAWCNAGLFDTYGIAGSKHNYHWDAEADGVAACENSYEYPQVSACFIQAVQDSLQDKMRLA